MSPAWRREFRDSERKTYLGDQWQFAFPLGSLVKLDGGESRESVAHSRDD
jgi:hypothetical protein